MTDHFVKVPCQILMARDLSSTDKLTWCAIASFCYEGKPICFPSHEKIGAKIGKSRLRILSSVQKLVHGGYLKVTKTGRRTCEYEPCLPVANSEHVPKTEHVSKTILMSVSKTEHVVPMSIENDTGPVSKTEHKEEQLNKKEKSTPPTPPAGGSGRRKNFPLLKKPEEIKDVLTKIDLGPIRVEWPEVDVDTVFAEFSEYMLTGSAEKPYPNPKNYRDILKALGNWCRRRASQYADRRVAQNAYARNPDSPIAATPKLSPEQAKEREEKRADALAWAEIDSDVFPPWQFEQLQGDARASPDYDHTDKHALKNAMIRLWRKGWIPKNNSP